MGGCSGCRRQAYPSVERPERGFYSEVNIGCREANRYSSTSLTAGTWGTVWKAFPSALDTVWGLLILDTTRRGSEPGWVSPKKLAGSRGLVGEVRAARSSHPPHPGTPALKTVPKFPEDTLTKTPAFVVPLAYAGVPSPWKVLGDAAPTYPYNLSRSL